MKKNPVSPASTLPTISELLEPLSSGKKSSEPSPAELKTRPPKNIDPQDGFDD